jgi:carbamoyl-phosphate synthase small subunit
MAQLVLQDGTIFEGESFGAEVDADGEVVFSTGMAGYVESLTDPSYRGQILVFTYPLIGNYGVPSGEKNAWGFADHLESEAIHVRGVVVSQMSDHFSHQAAVSSLGNWLAHHKIPGVTGVDTRALTKKLREHGVMLGRIAQGEARTTCHELRGSTELTMTRCAPPEDIEDPNQKNLVEEVSCKEARTYEPKENAIGKSVVVFDCGIKNNILRSFLRRGVTVHRVPWDFDLTRANFPFQGVFISNGPGDPKKCTATIAQIRWSIGKGIPTFGICLGNQLMGLAVGGDTFKLKYGHRGVNQPCIESPTPHPPSPGGGGGGGEGRCIITSQNHGFALRPELPAGWHVWFTNANDGTVEGIRHESGRFFAVQFHPEATPGPEDANYLFDEFVARL